MDLEVLAVEKTVNIDPTAKYAPAKIRTWLDQRNIFLNPSKAKNNAHLLPDGVIGTAPAITKIVFGKPVTATIPGTVEVTFTASGAAAGTATTVKLTTAQAGELMQHLHDISGTITATTVTAETNVAA